MKLMLVAPLMVALFGALAMWFAYSIQTERATERRSADLPTSPLELARVRLARGEISPQEYDALVRLLRRP